MAYLTAAIANSFLGIAKLAEKSADPMQIQKLVYLSRGWHLGYGRGSLSAERVQAWRWGPVFPKLYRDVKTWGSGPVTTLISVWRPNGLKTRRWFTPHVPPEDTFAVALINRVWDVYGGMSGLTLSQLTHEVGGPWQVTRHQNPTARHVVIPNNVIQGYFEHKLQANRDKQNQE